MQLVPLTPQMKAFIAALILGFASTLSAQYRGENPILFSFPNLQTPSIEVSAQMPLNHVTVLVAGLSHGPAPAGFGASSMVIPLVTIPLGRLNGTDRIPISPSMLGRGVKFQAVVQFMDPKGGGVQVVALSKMIRLP